jgi:hypothetical protein
MTFEEIIAAVLFYSNFVLAATAVSLSVVLFRHYRNCGWLIMACAFSSPFVFLLLRVAHDMPLLTYRSMGSDVNGVAQVTYTWRFPGFYFAVVAALLFLIRDTRRGK